MDPLDPSSRLRAVRLAMTLVTTSLLMAMASCGAPGELDARGATGEVGAYGAAPVWTAAPNQSLEPGTSEFTVLVSRLGCNNGVTGEVREPDVRLDAQRVVLTFAVEPDEPSAANCLSNDQVRFDVTLEEPLGERELVDGHCLSGGEASERPYAFATARSEVATRERRRVLLADRPGNGACAIGARFFARDIEYYHGSIEV